MSVCIRLFALVLVLINGMPSAACTSLSREQLPPRCSAIAPATIQDRSVRWLGPCVAGKAEGLGVLRIGQREPFAFLVGRMKAGKPASGLVIRANGNYHEAMGFDSRGESIFADGEHLREQDQVWADAVRAARSVGDRFFAAGNRSSAAYYHRFADKIKNGRPE